MFLAARELFVQNDLDAEVMQRAFWKCSRPHELVFNLLQNFAAFSDREIPLKLIDEAFEHLPNAYRKEIIWRCADCWRETANQLDYLPLLQLYHRITAAF